MIRAWERIGAPEHVLDWIKDGVRLPVESDPGNFQCDNRIKNVREFEFVDKEVSSLLERGAIIKSQTKPQCVSGLKCVPKKGNNKYRLIIDLRILNECVLPQKFQYEGIKTVKGLIRSNDRLVTTDLKNGFHHVPIHVDDWKYLGFCWKQEFYVWCVLPFGLKCSPYFFHKFLRPVVCFLREQGIRVVIYVDDCLLLSEPSSITDHRDFLLQVFEELGLHINFEKSSLEPSCEKKFIGFLVNSQGPDGYPWITVPKDKVRKLQRDIDRLLRQNPVKVRFLARIAGLCNSMTEAVLPAKLLLRNVYRVIASRASWEDTVVLDIHAISDLRWWRTALHNWNGTPIVVRPIEAQVVTDASGVGWGAFYEDREASGLWDCYVAQKPSNYRELMAIYLAIMSFAPYLKGKCVQILSDNVTSVAYLNQLGGPSRELSDLTRSIWLYAHRHGIVVTAKHLAGKLNTRADRLSRPSVHYEWKLHPRLFRYLDRLWGPHHVDRFASCLTAQLPTYNSRYYDPQSSGTDALAQQNWGQFNNFVNPPFRMIPQILGVLRVQRATATVIAPYWPGQIWCQQLRLMCIAPPLRLPNSRQTMLKMGPVAEPLRNPRWKIFAWRVSGAIA